MAICPLFVPYDWGAFLFVGNWCGDGANHQTPVGATCGRPSIQ
ncbi:MAG: hypothetical protein R3Y53_05275 [Bacillota bacterium]